MNSLNKPLEWQIEQGVAVAGATFVATTIALEYLSWQVQIPFSRDIDWVDWPLLKKALWGCTLSTLGIETKSWLDIAALLKVYGYKTLFLWHF